MKVMTTLSGRPGSGASAQDDGLPGVVLAAKAVGVGPAFEDGEVFGGAEDVFQQGLGERGEVAAFVVGAFGDVRLHGEVEDSFVSEVLRLCTEELQDPVIGKVEEGGVGPEGIELRGWCPGEEVGAGDGATGVFLCYGAELRGGIDSDGVVAVVPEVSEVPAASAADVGDGAAPGDELQEAYVVLGHVCGAGQLSIFFGVGVVVGEGCVHRGMIAYNADRQKTVSVRIVIHCFMSVCVMDRGVVGFGYGTDQSD